MIWIYAILSVFIVSIISLIGIFYFYLKNINKILLILVSFAAGALIGDAFIHLIPEAFEEIENDKILSFLIISGIFLFFVLEKFLLWRHCHIPTSMEHPHPLATMNIIGDGLHNFIDGLIIGSSYLVNSTIGLTTTIAVILHEIPQEIGDFGILLFAGFKKGKALLFNFLSALTAFFGVIVSLILGPTVQNFPAYLLPITAGGFIYIGGSDLIPQLQKCVPIKMTILQFLSLILGIGLMFLLLLIE